MVEFAAGQQVFLEFRTAVMFGLAFIQAPTLRILNPPPH
jgi:hypothetical protein